MFSKKISLLILLLTFVAMKVYGQLSISANAHRGFLIAHRPIVEGLRNDKIRGYELSFSSRLSGKKQWHHDLNLPQWGVSSSFWNLGNKNTLGNAISVAPFIDFNLLKKRKLSINLKFGWGIGYIDKKFDADKNYKNVAIGSRINNSVTLYQSIVFKLAKNINVNLGISLSHYSNGSFEIPNLGINLVSLTTGVTLKFGTDSIYVPQIIDQPNRKRTSMIYCTSFLKEVGRPDDRKYLASNMVFETMWRSGKANSIGLGIDIFYDQSLSKKRDLEDKNGVLDLMRSGIHGGAELHIGKTSIVLNMGAYFYSGIVGESVYHRLGIRQKLNEKWSLLMHVKSHWGKADCMELGIGKVLNKKARKITKI